MTDPEEEKIKEKKRIALEALQCNPYVEHIEAMHRYLCVYVRRGGQSVDEIRQQLLAAGFLASELTVEYSPTSNFAMAFE